jgi:hypothetical protein
MALGGVSATGGVFGQDTCFSDSDCVRCIWETAPSDGSACDGVYCCGGMITTAARCEANRAAWQRYCPGQFPRDEVCPCVFPTCSGQAVASVTCMGGQCGLWCPQANGAGGSVVLPSGSGGYFGNEGAGGVKGGSGGAAGGSGASRAIVTCTFGGLLDDGQALTTSYTESGITVLATAGGWQARAAFGHPAPSIGFVASAGGTATGQVKVTVAGAPFSFVSVELYSSMTTIPYIFTGLLGSSEVFSASGTVPNTFGNFATVANPNAAALIDTLVIELTDGMSQNPMGLDNLRLIK